MVTAPPKPNVLTAVAQAFDEEYCTTGMSTAHAIAKSVIFQCLRERFPEENLMAIEETARQLAYDIAFSERHQQPLPVIASQAAGAAFNIGQETLDDVFRFLSNMPSAQASS